MPLVKTPNSLSAVNLGEVGATSTRYLTDRHASVLDALLSNRTRISN